MTTRDPLPLEKLDNDLKFGNKTILKGKFKIRLSCCKFDADFRPTSICQRLARSFSPAQPKPYPVLYSSRARLCRSACARRLAGLHHQSTLQPMAVWRDQGRDQDSSKHKSSSSSNLTFNICPFSAKR